MHGRSLAGTVMTPLFWALVPVFAGCVPLVAFAPAWHSGERWIFRQPAGPPPGQV